MGGSWDQIWPPRPAEDLRGPQKGLLEPKRALLGAIEVFKGPKCMILMRPTQAHCVKVFLMQFGPSRLFPKLSRGQKGSQK